MEGRRVTGPNEGENDSLGSLADVNLASTWAAMVRLGGGPTERVGPVQLFATGLSAAFFNGAVATGPSREPDACIARSVEFMAEHDVPWLLWVREGVDDALLDAGRKAGLRDAGGPPAMGWSLIAPPWPPPMDLEISVVDDHTGIEAHRDLTSRAFGIPPEIARRLVCDAMITDPGFAVVLGCVDGEPVSTALVSVTGTTVGVYNVATPAEHQCRGYGRALTRAAVDEGIRRGCDHAVLQSSPAGQPVYEAMGFTHLGSYVQLEGPPA
jgi:N-acetylglutamate synthase